jgi:hypothetical protein
MKKHIKLALPFLLSLALVGCAQQKVSEKKVDKEIKEVVIMENEKASDSAKDLVVRSDKLNEEQKRKLLDLQARTQTEIDSIKAEIEKTKLVLIKTILEPKMNQREYNILRKRISKLEEKRMDKGFKAMTEARNIISPKSDSESREFYRAYMHRHIQEW